MKLPRVLALLTAACLLWGANSAVAQTWRGLRVTPESRCSPYRASDYFYPQSIEGRIVESLGGIWSPYTGRTFASRRETDIEHIVARSEAHDSGLCAATAETRRRFATDLLNLTLASPGVNRGQKNARDAAAWLPDRNQCWFADRVVRVHQKYRLTIDRREAAALDRVLASCASTALARGGAPVAECIDFGGPSSELPAEVAQCDDNGNGRITCAEARTHGIAPVHGPVTHSQPAGQWRAGSAQRQGQDPADPAGRAGGGDSAVGRVVETADRAFAPCMGSRGAGSAEGLDRSHPRQHGPLNCGRRLHIGVDRSGVMERHGGHGLRHASKLDAALRAPVPASISSGQPVPTAVVPPDRRPSHL